MINNTLSNQVILFDRDALKHQKNRTAQSFVKTDFLFRQVGEDVADRLRDINRSFSTVADVGSHGGLLASLMPQQDTIKTFLATDLSYKRLKNSGLSCAVVADEEYLPLAQNSFDLILSCLSLHWVNDLPGTLIQINRALQPDGLFLGALFGRGTLHELRTCLTHAESRHIGGTASRVSPFPDVKDMGSLLQRAGFALPVVDTQTLRVDYATPWRLLQDLRHMGEANVLKDRSRHPLRRKVLMDAMDLYMEMFQQKNGRFSATFEVIYLHGWRQSPTQQKALSPGSGVIPLDRVL